jgi:PAS domain S-box-containing protein
MPFHDKKDIAVHNKNKTRRRLPSGANSPISNRFHTFSEDSPDSMAIVEGSGRFIAMNASAREMLGYSWQDIPSLDLVSIGATAIRDRLGEFRRIGRVRAEAQALRKDGARLRAVFNTAAMGDGCFQFVIAEVSEPETRAEPLHEEAPLPLVELRLGSGGPVVQGMNGSALLLCGPGQARDLDGASPTALLGIGEAELAGLIEKARNSGASACEGSWILGRGDGSRRYFKVCASAPRSTGEAEERVVLSLCDLTEEKQAEARLLASAGSQSLLLKEAQHRIKNSLTLLSSILALQRGAMKDDVCASFLLAAQVRIQTIAHFHDRLSRAHGDELRLDLRAYFGDIVADIERAYMSGDKPIRVELEVEEMELDAKRSATLGLIVNELMTNSLKYAFADRPAGTMRLRARRTDGLLELCVSDDGVGLPQGLDWRASKGLGFRFIDMLTHQLAAQVTVDGSRGFSFSMAVKI